MIKFFIGLGVGIIVGAFAKPVKVWIVKGWNWLKAWRMANKG